MAAAMTPIGHHRLALAHGVSANAILLLFIGPHIVNHVAGFWNGPLHIAIMNVVRRVYRDDIVQPVLLALIGFQILSGIALVRRRMRMPSDIFGTVQTMCGAYIGVYLLAHMTAVFAARHAGVDTNWSWLTRPNDSLLVSLTKLRLIAHYWVGPIAIVAHVACGLRWALLQRDISPATANRTAWALIAVGAVTSSIILIALLGVHIA
jgi:succinate dehydrogenase/fumarate reductase cytochrome b subunit